MDLRDIVNDPARLQVFDEFLEEACRQWCDFIDDEPERATGEGFAGFFYEIFEMKEEEMLEELNAQVNASVERILAGDRTKLPVKEVADEALVQELADYRESGARVDAIQRFMSGRVYASFVSCYHVDHLAGDSMAAYLEDPDEYIQAQAEDYIKNSGEKLLVQFLKLDALEAELAQINSEAEGQSVTYTAPVHQTQDVAEDAAMGGMSL